MRAVALITAGHATDLRGRKLRVELKNQTLLLIQVAQVRLAARRYVLEDICKKLLHRLLIDRRESKPALQQGLRAESLHLVQDLLLDVRHGGVLNRLNVRQSKELSRLNRGAFNVDAVFMC